MARRLILLVSLLACVTTLLYFGSKFSLPNSGSKEEAVGVSIPVDSAPDVSPRMSLPGYGLAWTPEETKSDEEGQSEPAAPVSLSLPGEGRPTEQVISPLEKRLAATKTRSSEFAKTPAGGEIQRKLVRTDGKYPDLVLVRESRAGGPDREVAYVADHVIVRAPGSTKSSLDVALEQLGLSVTGVIPGRSDHFLVSIPNAGAASIEETLDDLHDLVPSLDAEPDYVVFAGDLVHPPIVVDGTNLQAEDAQAIDPETHDYIRLESAAPTPTYAPGASAWGDGAPGVNSVPANARLLHFDPPNLDGSFRPEVAAHNFILTTANVIANPGSSSSVYLQGAYNSGSPNNGGQYVRVLSADGSMILSHRDGIPFDALSVDLSEYSTVFPYPKSIAITGTKSGGGTVTQHFVTDGIIDGTGPADDFETFTFNSSFTDIVELELENAPFMLDNLIVVLNGQESPLPPDPELPVIYDVDWNDDPHEIGQATAVGGRDAPSSLNFGAAIVRSSFGALTDRPLEIMGIPSFTSYGQPRFDLRLGATSYELEFDATQSHTDSFRVFMDGVGGLISYEISPALTSTGTISHYLMSVDFVTGSWSILEDGTQIGGGSTTITDVKAIRFSVTDSARDGGTAVDNVQIRAYGIGAAPSPAPMIVTSPNSGVTFPETPLAGSDTAFVRIRNNGTADLDVASATVNGSGFTVTSLSGNPIIPGGFEQVTVTFSPTLAGPVSATLDISSDDPATPLLQLALSGIGVGTPTASVAPAQLDATVVAGTIGMESYTLNNTGTGDLDWRLIRHDSVGSPANPAPGNDPSLGSLWGLKDSAFGGIDATRAWSITTEAPGITIAVIDTGIDLSHPELSPNLIANTGEVPGNGIDDDGNGQIDDILGWDFSANDNDPDDGNGHGTHVAGTIGAQGNDGVGVVGVCWKTNLLPIKFLSDKGSGYTSDAIAAVTYAEERGARVINASWGGGGYSALLRDAIDAFCSNNDALFIASAGNSGLNNDQYNQYPASYPVAGIISVAAIDSGQELATFSNYGTLTVDVAAPGAYVLSTYKNDDYAYLSGTSMAAPHVAGSVALLMDSSPEASAEDVEYFIYDWVDRPASLNGKVVSGGRINIYQSLSRVHHQWLSPSPVVGTISPGGTQLVNLQIDATSLAPGLYSSVLAFSTNDPNNNPLLLPVDLTVVSSTQYNSWRHTNWGDSNLLFSSQAVDASSGADPDGDGVANILEFLYGTSPESAQSSHPVSISTATAVSSFEFTLVSTHAGVTYDVEWSPDMSVGSWSNSGMTGGAVSSNTVTGTTTYRYQTNATPAPDQCFYRLSVNESP